MKKPGKDPKTGQFQKGHQLSVKHGVYSGRLPLRLRRHLAAVRADIEAEIGQGDKLTAIQELLLGRALGLLGVTMAIEEYVRSTGVFKGKKLDPVLGNHYTAYMNTFRLFLRDLSATAKKPLGPKKTRLELFLEKRDADKKA